VFFNEVDNVIQLIGQHYLVNWTEVSN